MKSPLQARIKEWLSGHDQLGSVISSWDHMCHCLRMRNKCPIGVYMVRVDIKVLQGGLAEWPVDKLCFLWKTKWDESSASVNDVFFYVPLGLFREFRSALSEPPTWGKRWGDNTQNIHWISENESVKAHVWLEYDFNHPSNTAKEQNPRYVMTCREPACEPLNVGKFKQHELEKWQVDSTYKWQADSLSPSARFGIWCKRVKRILDEQYAQDKPLRAHDFATLWTEHWPNDAIAWYKPDDKLLKSMERCEEVIRLDSTTLAWKSPPPARLGRRALRHCGDCGFAGEGRPYWTCGMCYKAVCVVCGHHSWDIAVGLATLREADRFRCETSWLIPPWKRREAILVEASPPPKRTRR